MQFLSKTLITSAILLSISTSWASDREMMMQPRSAPDVAPPPAALPVPPPETGKPPTPHPAPAATPIHLPKPTAMPERRPQPPKATPITSP